MKHYKISEFSKRCGISADTLRYYEKAKLLSPRHDPNNKYRYYTDDDLVQLFHLRCLRGMDIPVSELGNQREHRLERFHASVSKQVDALEQEIRILERKLQRFQRIKGELEECRSAVGRVTDSVFPELYCFYLADEDISEDTQQVIAELSEHNAYAHMSFLIPAHQLTDSAVSVFSAVPGIGILSTYARACQLQHIERLEMMEEGTGVRALLQISDPLHPTREELLPVFEHLQKTNQVTIGDWYYRLRLIEQLPDGGQCCYVVIRVYTRHQ